jgi:hypothetical protein
MSRFRLQLRNRILCIGPEVNALHWTRNAMGLEQTLIDS